MKDLISSSDRDLWLRVQSGDEQALTLIFNRYWEPMFSTAYGILGDKGACEDIIQDIFITVWNKREAIALRYSLKAYLFSCMRYELYRQMRRGVKREQIFNQFYARLQNPSFLDQIEHKELADQIQSAINALPSRCQEVYRLSREEHLSHKEIAERLNISTKTVENHISKALRQVRLSLDTLGVGVILLGLF